ncbi:MAG: guanylate kinase [bacterium]
MTRGEIENYLRKGSHICVILGPSGSGKSTIIREMFFNLGYVELVSTTTRNVRYGEHDGIDYHFKTKEEFFTMREKDAFVECVPYDNGWYGVTKQEIKNKLKKHRKLLVIMDAEGAEQLKKYAQELVNVIYVYCTPEESRQRMLDRGDDLQDVEDRMRHDMKLNVWDNFHLADFVIKNHDNQQEQAKLQTREIVKKLTL